jgi:hypothetical protein
MGLEEDNNNNGRERKDRLDNWTTYKCEVRGIITYALRHNAGSALTYIYPDYIALLYIYTDISTSFIYSIYTSRIPRDTSFRPKVSQ